MTETQLSQWVDDPERFDWEIIQRVDPVGAAGCVLSEVVPRLHEFADDDAFRDVWPALNDPNLLSSEMAPIVAAIIAWRRAAPSPDDLAANLTVLLSVLQAAADQYEDTRADMRGMRMMPVAFASEVAEAAGEDAAVIDGDLQALAGGLLEGFWACLGQRSSRWCASFSITGPMWRQAPTEPARRGALLLAALNAGVPDMTLSAHLAAALPDEPQRFLRPRVPDLLDRCARAGFTPDVRLLDRQRQGWRVRDLPRSQWQLSLGDRGLTSLLFDAPESLTAPFADEPIALPWLANCDDGVFFGYCLLNEDQERAMYRVTPDEDDTPDDLTRRAMRYANIIPDDLEGTREAMTSIILACLHDISDPAVLAEQYAEQINPQENDPSIPRARRRELRRQRERGQVSAWKLRPCEQPTTWSAIAAMRA